MSVEKLIEHFEDAFGNDHYGDLTIMKGWLRREIEEGWVEKDAIVAEIEKLKDQMFMYTDNPEINPVIDVQLLDSLLQQIRGEK
jgi:hypothetical protein